MAESEWQEAERDFRAARNDIRADTQTYERCRDSVPLGKRSAKARSASHLNVHTWLATAVAVEEAWERVMLLTWNLGPSVEPSGEHPADMPALVYPECLTENKPLPPLKQDVENLDDALRGRLQRTGADFDEAAEAMKQARTTTDQAYATYRTARTKATREQVDTLREAWRTSLVKWAYALLDRETAREKALAARRRVEWNSDVFTFSPNVHDYEPENEYIPDEDCLF